MILHKIGIQSSSTLNYAEFKFLPKNNKEKKWRINSINSSFSKQGLQY